MTDTPTDLKTLTADLVSAYLVRNKVTAGDLPGLIEVTYGALARAGEPAAPSLAEPEHVPAVSIRKSLASPDHILSMIDGKPYVTLRRHLTRHGLTPDEYRARYKLSADYPMVAKGYSERRSEMAKAIGLGAKGRGAKGKGKAPAKTGRGKLKLFGSNAAAASSGEQG